MKYITILFLLFTLACEKPPKRQNADKNTSLKDMEVFIDESSLITLGGTSEIWVKRVFPEGKYDEVTSIAKDGKKNAFNYDGIASLVLLDCKQQIYILDEIYYFMGDKPVTEMDNRKERIEDKSKWSKVEPGNYMEKVFDFACKPKSE